MSAAAQTALAPATAAPRPAPGSRRPVRAALFSNQYAAASGHGLRRYAMELHAALRAEPDLEVTPVAGWTSLPKDALAALRRDTGLRLTGLGRRLTAGAWTWLDAPPLERLLDFEIDVVHAASLGYPVATRKPFIVSIHDLGPLTRPEFFRNTRPWVMRRSLDQAVRRADAIHCVSQSTADEVCGLVGERIADRITVIREGVSERFFEPVAEEKLRGLDLPPDGAPFVLCAGKISPRKNVDAVLRAMESLIDLVPHHLVLVGGDGWDSKAVFEGLRDSRFRERVRTLGFVDDTQLRALYRRAAIYVHPSLYEGFGLTVLEAMASGTPVVTSNRSSLPEVAGDAALLVDPTDVGALADAIGGLCWDPAEAARLAARGEERARSFVWSDCARGVARLYRGIACATR